VVWVFAEEKAAEAALRLFDANDDGRENIVIVHIPWVRNKR
jgi:hypothetical protein